MTKRTIAAGFLKTGSKFLAVIMILAFSGASLPQMAASAADDDVLCQDTYTVQSGDWLVKIAAKYTGITYLDIANANDLEAPYTLTAGRELCIPKKGATGSTGGSGSPGTSTGTGGQIVVEERSGDRIRVTVTNLGRNSSYFVKVDNADKSATEWFRVGLLKTDGDREGEDTFDLPEELEKAKSFNVCLKNTSNDDLICNDPALTRLNDGKDDDDDDPDGSSSFKGTFTVDRLSNDIVITTSSFPEDNHYNVKVGEAGSGVPDWSIIGVLHTQDDSSGSYRYDLPEELEDVDDIYVCLKNTRNDTVRCVVNSD
jgi:LysM repeat protein